MAFGLTQAVSHLEQRSTATVKYVFCFIASCLGICIWRLSAGIDNMNRVVVVSVFYETKRQQTIKYISPRMIKKSTDNCEFGNNKLNGKLMFGGSRNQGAITIFSLFVLMSFYWSLTLTSKDLTSFIINVLHFKIRCWSQIFITSGTKLNYNILLCL